MSSRDNDGFELVSGRKGRRGGQQNNRPTTNQQPLQANRAQRRAAVQSHNGSTSSRPAQSNQNAASSRPQHIARSSNPSPTGPIGSWQLGASSINTPQPNVPHQVRQINSPPMNAFPPLSSAAVPTGPRAMMTSAPSQHASRPKPSSLGQIVSGKPSPLTNNTNQVLPPLRAETGNTAPSSTWTAPQSHATRTEVRAPTSRPDHNRTKSAPMASQAQSSKKKEKIWVKGPKGGGTDGWAKLNQEQEKQDQADRDAYYRQTLPGNDEFRYMRVVHWRPIPEAAEKHLKSHRTESLLKQIQVDKRCFIWYTATVDLGSEVAPGLVIVGNHQERIDAVTNQLKSFPNWLQAEQLSDAASRCSTFWLVKATSLSNVDVKICSTTYESPERSRHFAAKPESTLLFAECKGKGKAKATDDDAISEKTVLSLTELDEGEAIIGGPSATHVNALYLEAFLMRLLRQLQFRRGSPEMRVQVGTCVMVAPPKATKGEGCSTGIFKDRLCEVNRQEYDMKGRLTAELGNMVYERKVISNFANSPIFEEGSDVRYGATFMIKHPSLVDEALQLDIPFGYLKERPRWSIVDRQTFEPRKLLKVHLLDLQDTALSYGIDLALRDSLDVDIDTKRFDNIVTLRYRKFAEGVDLKDNHEASFERDGAGSCCIRIPTEPRSTQPTVPLYRFTQYRRRSYKTIDRGYDPYHVEVTEFRVFEFADADSKAQEIKEEPDGPELRVQVSVSHPDWQYFFAQNEGLLPGQSEWTAEEKLFFPCKPAENDSPEAGAKYARGDGLKELLHVLALVDETIKA